MKLAVRIAKQPDGTYKAWCPALPGCVVLAGSREETHTKIRAAVEGYLASLDVALPRDVGQILHTDAACGVA